MKSFVNFRDKYGSELFARELSDSIYTCALDGTNAASLTVPTGSRFCIIGGSDYWVSSVANPVIPSANTFAAGNAEFEASTLNVEGVATLYFKSEIASKVSVGFYR